MNRFSFMSDIPGVFNPRPKPPDKRCCLPKNRFCASVHTIIPEKTETGNTFWQAISPISVLARGTLFAFGNCADMRNLFFRYPFRTGEC